jgi:hypothetical protein
LQRTPWFHSQGKSRPDNWQCCLKFESLILPLNWQFELVVPGDRFRSDSPHTLESDAAKMLLIETRVWRGLNLNGWISKFLKGKCGLIRHGLSCAGHSRRLWRHNQWEVYKRRWKINISIIGRWAQKFPKCGKVVQRIEIGRGSCRERVWLPV